MFTRIDDTTSRSLDGTWELRKSGAELEIWRRIDTLHAPTIDQLQTAILRAGRRVRQDGAVLPFPRAVL